MQKKIKFSVKLVSKALDALDLGGAAGEAVYKTEVCVVVNGIGGIGGDEMWSHEKFHNRIYIMREMYHTWKDNDMDLGGTEFEDKENDPFYDPPSDYLLGVARLQLEAIKYMLDVDESTPLVDYKGSSFGEIMVEMVPSMRGEGEDDEVEDLGEVLGEKIKISIEVKGLRGLPMSLLKNTSYKKVYVKYRFFGGEDFLVSPEYALKMNMEAAWKEVLQFRVSKELCDYVMGAALGFEVWVTTGGRGGGTAEAEGDWEEGEGGREGRRRHCAKGTRERKRIPEKGE